LTPDQRSIVRGRRYNRTKEKQGGTGANQHQQKLQGDTYADTAIAIAAQRELGKFADLCHDTIAKLKIISQQADEPTKKGYEQIR